MPLAKGTPSRDGSDRRAVLPVQQGWEGSEAVHGPQGGVRGAQCLRGKCLPRTCLPVRALSPD